MEPGNHPPPARIAGLKAALAAVGVVFFVLAVTLPARWAYAVGALLLLASVVAGRKPRQRTPHHPKHTSEHNDHPPRPEYPTQDDRAARLPAFPRTCQLPAHLAPIRQHVRDTTAAFSLGLVVSALAGIRVGRILNHPSPQAAITTGSALNTASLTAVATAPKDHG